MIYISPNSTFFFFQGMFRSFLEYFCRSLMFNVKYLLPCVHFWEGIFSYVLKHHLHPREECGQGGGTALVVSGPALSWCWSFSHFWAHLNPCWPAWVYSGVFGGAVAVWNRDSGDVHGNTQNREMAEGFLLSLSCAGTGRLWRTEYKTSWYQHRPFP